MKKRNNLLLVVLLVFLAPAGFIYFLASKDDLSKQKKIILGTIFSIWWLILVNAFLGPTATKDTPADTGNAVISENVVTDETETEQTLTDTEQQIQAALPSETDSSETISIPETETEDTAPDSSESTDPVTSGIYTIAGLTFTFSDSVNNDMTNNWRISTIDSQADASTYAVEYYNTMFESDKEIHAIINSAMKTTTKISVLYSGMLDITVHEYIDGEENDAAVLFSGTVLDNYQLEISSNESANTPQRPDTTALVDSEIPATTVPPASSETAAPQETASSETSNPADPISDTDSASINSETPASTEDNSDGDSNSGGNFNTYDNAEQQQTTASYVLNTSTMKIHVPHCSSVKKIAPQNYATSNLSISELEAQGYSRCGHCLK